MRDFEQCERIEITYIINYLLVVDVCERLRVLLEKNAFLKNSYFFSFNFFQGHN